MAHMHYMQRGGQPLHTPTGSIHVVCGPMFSGKTTELLRRMKRFSLAKRKCMLIKYANDNRYSLEGVVTHDMQQSAAVACSKLEEVREKAETFDVLGIDEGQFFPDLVEFSERMANEGKTVIVAALDGTFQRKPFGAILDLIPLAESVIKLSAVCMMCHKEAAFSKRLGSETEIEVIGGADKYVAVCRECYHADASSAVDGKPTANSNSHRTGSGERDECRRSSRRDDDCEEEHAGSNDSDTESSSSACSDDCLDTTPTKKQVGAVGTRLRFDVPTN